MPPDQDAGPGRDDQALSERLQSLLREQASVSADYRELGRRIAAIDRALADLAAPASGFAQTRPGQGAEPPPLPVTPRTPATRVAPDRAPAPVAAPPAGARPRPTARFERFVGENLIALVGIGILLLGVGIGVRYAIENDLISPLVRIIAAYVTGAVLTALAERLRTRGYDLLAPVLIGGGAAVLYFTTFVAYDAYGLIPVSLAYGLMVALTAFTVLAALRYDRQVIALLGSVGAYGVPLLLSTGGGSAAALLTYISVVNLGIVAVSYRRAWRVLLYTAFALSWLALGAATLGAELTPQAELTFAAIFFATFYAAALGRGVAFGGRITGGDVAVVAVNALLVYAVGYGALERLELQSWLGAFTLACAAVHVGVGALLRRDPEARAALVPLAAGLALVFVVVAVPVQLDGAVVTASWAALALLMTWLAARRAEWRRLGLFAGVLYTLAFVSLVDDLQSAYDLDGRLPVLNPVFLTGILVVGSTAAAGYLAARMDAAPRGRRPFDAATTAAVAGLASTALAFGLGANEVHRYWAELTRRGGLGAEASFGLAPDPSYPLREQVWLVVYALAFAAILAVGVRRLAPRRPAWLSLGLVLAASAAVIAYLTVGLFALSELRGDYQATLAGYSEYAPVRSWAPLGRYLACALAAGLCWVVRAELRHVRPGVVWWRVGELAACMFVLWVSTAELLHWLDLAGARNQYKLSVSLLWGGFALALTVVGLVRGRAHLRVAGIALFAVTLIKLFAYDLSALTTVAKTIVLVVLGMLLLVTSFAYTKYKSRLGADDDE